MIPLAIRDLNRLQILDMSDNALFCTAEHPVRFSTAGSALSPNAECVHIYTAVFCSIATTPLTTVHALDAAILSIPGARRYNLSAASWLADRALFPDLRIMNLSSSVLQIGEAILVQARRWAEGLDVATQVLAFAWFATRENDPPPTLTFGRQIWQARHLFDARDAAPEVHSLEAFAGDHWFHTFVVSGGTLLLNPGDIEVDLEPELESEPDV